VVGALRVWIICYKNNEFLDIFQLKYIRIFSLILKKWRPQKSGSRGARPSEIKI